MVAEVARRIVAVLKAYGIDGSLAMKTANLCLALRWSSNTYYYTTRMGRAPNYVAPACWTDRMQWRKLFDRNPLLGICCDKIRVRDHAAAIAPDLAFPELLWLGSDPKRIPFDAIAPPYVVKSTHASGDIIIVGKHEHPDRKRIVAACRRWLGRSYGRKKAEWGYRKARRQILVERLLIQPGSDDLPINYKFFVFDGKVAYTQVSSHPGNRDHLTYLDRDGARLPIKKWIGRLAPGAMPQPDPELLSPTAYPEMVSMAERLGEGWDHIRVDLYLVDGRIYLSELTPYDGSGSSYLYNDTETFDVRPSEALNREFGDLWTLPHISRWKMAFRGLVG